MDQKELEGPLLFKGLVLECSNQQFHVMTDEGELYALNYQHGHKPGDQIYFVNEDIREPAQAKVSAFKAFVTRGSRTIGALAAVILLFCITTFGGGSVALMSVDINPSLEMELNQTGKVRKVVTLNADADTLIRGMDLNGIAYKEALKRLLERAKEQGYVIDDNRVLIAIAPISKDGISLVADMKTQLMPYAQNHKMVLLEGTETDAQAALGKKESLGKELYKKQHKTKTDNPKSDCENDLNDDHSKEDNGRVEKETESDEVEDSKNSLPDDFENHENHENHDSDDGDEEVDDD